MAEGKGPGRKKFARAPKGKRPAAGKKEPGKPGFD